MRSFRMALLCAAAALAVLAAPVAARVGGAGSHDAPASTGAFGLRLVRDSRVIGSAASRHPAAAIAMNMAQSAPVTVGLGSKDSTPCAVCTLLIAVLEQYVEVHNKTAEATLEEVCDLFPNKTKAACELAIKVFGPEIIDNLDKKFGGDRICQELGFCSGKCRLFPKTAADEATPFTGSKSSAADTVAAMLARDGDGDMPAICNLTALKPICEALYRWGNDNEPLDDHDGDGFSPLVTFRGADWRGKDCDDTRADVHPGALPIDSDREVDSNCNGIFGVAPDGTPYEDKFCKGTEARGVVVLGDSASAHFHVPPNYLTAQNIDGDTFKNLLTVAENEADWPMFSATTGFDVNDSRFVHDITGPVNSTYLTLRNRNRCMHRDYQNIAVNGARAGAMNDHIQQTMSRNQVTDAPVSLMYALIGNDVCNGHIDDYVNHMTTPDDMRTAVQSTLDYLETTLPKGSHVTMMGLADGMILFETMHAKIHPIGDWRQDVTYANVYDYLNCLEISPCGGWMTSNATLRNLTQARANELSAVIKAVVDNATAVGAYSNFDAFFFPNPFADILAEWEAQGGQAWQLIEPVDGFHPGQLAQPLVVEKFFQWAAKNDYPLVPEVNPNNAAIEAQFGDQGGYV